MAKNNSNTITKESEIELIQNETLKFDNTSKKIRFLASLGFKNKEIYNLINKFGVTTKNGGEIRYQHVRNVMMTKLSSEE